MSPNVLKKADFSAKIILKDLWCSRNSTSDKIVKNAQNTCIYVCSLRGQHIQLWTSRVYLVNQLS